MEAMITNIKKFAVHDGDGIRTTVFFKGCPLACKWCHNPECIDFGYQISYLEEKCIHCFACTELCKANTVEPAGHVFDKKKCALCGACDGVCSRGALKFYGKKMSVNAVFDAVMEDRDFYEESGGVTLSGGECLMQWKFCVELLKRLKEEGINTAVDTCGYVSRKVLDAVIPYTDTFLYDVKAITPEVHIRCTGKDNQLILDNLLYLDDLGKRIEIRIPLVPGYNDMEMEKVADFLGKLRNISGVRVLKYHNLSASRYRGLEIPYLARNAQIPTASGLDKAKQILSDKGLNVLA